MFANHKYSLVLCSGCVQEVMPAKFSCRHNGKMEKNIYSFTKETNKKKKIENLSQVFTRSLTKKEMHETE